MSDMHDVAAFMKTLVEPFGDYAPAVRHFSIDYKRDGQDYNTEVCSAVPRGASDASLVESLRDHIQRGGGELSAIWEPREGALPGCLYVKVGTLEQSAKEQGLSFPADPLEAMRRCGWNPVNLPELCEYWGIHERQNH